MKFVVLAAAAVFLFSGCASPRHRRAALPTPPPSADVVNLGNPSVVVFFDRESSEPQIRQRLLLRSAREGLAARGISVLFAWERVEDLDGQPVTTANAEELRRALKAPAVGFSVMLVDANGQIRWSAGEPQTPAALAAQFDRSPAGKALPAPGSR